MLKDFKSFIMRGNVVDMAVGIISKTGFCCPWNEQTYSSTPEANLEWRAGLVGHKMWAVLDLNQ